MVLVVDGPGRLGGEPIILIIIEILGSPIDFLGAYFPNDLHLRMQLVKLLPILRDELLSLGGILGSCQSIDKS